MGTGHGKAEQILCNREYVLHAVSRYSVSGAHGYLRGGNHSNF